MRQQHGIDYETKIISKYSLAKSTNYTSKYDAYYNKIPVQIKCIKMNSSIELGDFRRNQDHNKDFILVVGFWELNKTNISKEVIIKINGDIFSQHAKFDRTNEMLAEMKTVSNSRCDDLKWRNFRKKWKNIYPKENIIKLRFKRDHSKQKRIQCAITFNQFFQKIVKNSIKHVF